MSNDETLRSQAEYYSDLAAKLQFFFSRKRDFVPLGNLNPTTRFIFMHPFQVYQLMAKNPFVWECKLPEELKGNPRLCHDLIGKIENTWILQSTLVPVGEILMTNDAGPFIGHFAVAMRAERRST